MRYISKSCLIGLVYVASNVLACIPLTCIALGYNFGFSRNAMYDFFLNYGVRSDLNFYRPLY